MNRKMSVLLGFVAALFVYGFIGGMVADRHDFMTGRADHADEIWHPHLFMVACALVLGGIAAAMSMDKR